MSDFRRPFRNHFPLELVHKKKNGSNQKTLFILFDTGCNFHWKGYVNMAGKLPQPDCKPRAFFAWHSNCMRCHPKRLPFHGSPAAIQSLNCFSWLTEDSLGARHSWQCSPLATRLQTLLAEEKVREWSAALTIAVKMISRALWRQSDAKPVSSNTRSQSTSIETSASYSPPDWRSGGGPGTSFTVCFA